MKSQFYSETSHQLLFTIFDSTKKRKVNQFRVHHHADLELGFIVSGEGDYLLEEECFDAAAGDLFLIRSNEQHCVHTIPSLELVSFNIHITSYFLWNVCAEFIDNRFLHLLVNAELPIVHRFRKQEEQLRMLRMLCAEPEKNRFLIRRAVMDLLSCLARQVPLPTRMEPQLLSPHLEDVQRAIQYIHEHLNESITLEDIARSAHMSRSYLSDNFRLVTGITPYEYLLLRRIEHAVFLLRENDMLILNVAQECGFGSIASFNRIFKRTTGMTPSAYRSSRQEEKHFTSKEQ